MKVTPRTYQRLATKAALKGLRGRSERALVVLATGLGKTLTSAFVAKEFRPKRLLFLVHNNFILNHAVEEYRLIFKKAGMAIFNGFSKDGAASADMVFATWQTMGKNLAMWKPGHFDLVIVDEAHHTEADTYRPVVDYFRAPKLGITATPDREDDANIRDVFGPEVVDVTLEEAIARGWLPRIEYHVATDESLNEEVLQKIAAEIRAGHRRFSMAEVNQRIFIRKRDKEIGQIINRHPEKSIVFCASIQHANRMKKVLKEAAVFHSTAGQNAADTWRKNQAVLVALEKGKTRRVCAVNAFNEGVNVPSVGLVAFCRVTESLTIFRQQLGRGLRPSKDKLIVLDFVGNLERIQLVLEMVNRISDLHERHTSKEERTREKYTRERFEVSGKGFEFTFSDRVVDLMKVLEHVERDYYLTWQEASKAALSLGLKSIEQYKKFHRRDPKLPPNLHYTYQGFPGSDVFFGRIRDRNRTYPNWKEAGRAAKRLGMGNERNVFREYTAKYAQDTRLPSNPQRTYKDFPGWPTFIGRTLRRLYPTWQEASKAAKKMKVQSPADYARKRRLDKQLPNYPPRKYHDFPGWDKFLGKS